MWNSAYTNYQVWVNFNANELLYISVKGWWSFEDIENTKKTGLCYDKKNVFVRATLGTTFGAN